MPYMPNRAKEKGTRFEHQISAILRMLGFYVIRSYSSMGVADLLASPPWNPKKNFRALVIQAKDQKAEDYLSPFERDQFGHTAQYNSGIVCVIYKKNGTIMVNYDGERSTLDMFLASQYGIVCKSREVLQRYRTYNRPIHLYPVDYEEYTGKDGKKRYKPVAPFQDFYSVKPWYPYVPENHRQHLNSRESAWCHA